MIFHAAEYKEDKELQKISRSVPLEEEEEGVEEKKDLRLSNVAVPIVLTFESNTL